MTRFGWYSESEFWGKSGKMVQSWYNERHTGPLDPGLDQEGVQLRFRQHWRLDYSDCTVSQGDGD